jgi:hypothetical protein
VYGNDWFIVPYEMPVNTLCEIKGFVVTDVFGERTLIQAANEGADNDWQRWSMFNLSNKDQIGNYNKQFYLPATLTQSMNSDPIEQVNFTRDEMVNMAWGIEDLFPDATSKGINGHDAAIKLALYRSVAESGCKDSLRTWHNSSRKTGFHFCPYNCPAVIRISDFNWR